MNGYTPDVFLDVAITTNTPDKSEVTAVHTSNEAAKGSVDGWLKVLADHELALLFGRVPFDHPQKSILTILQSAPCVPVPHESVASRDLTGFIASTKGLEIRVLFDPAHADMLRFVELTRPSELAEVGGITKASLIMEGESWIADGSMPVRLDFHQRGGEIKRPPPPGAVRVRGGNSEHRTIESASVAFSYEISEFSSGDGVSDECFSLGHAIPNESRVYIDGDDGDIRYVWADGNVVPDIPVKIREGIGKVSFQPNKNQWRTSILLLVNVAILAIFFAVWYLRRK